MLNERKQPSALTVTHQSLQVGFFLHLEQLLLQREAAKESPSVKYAQSIESATQ